MSLPNEKKAVYDDLYNLPENMTGEIIEGELHAHPRPHPRHANTITILGSELIPPYRFGSGGPRWMDHSDRAGINVGKEFTGP